MEKETTQLETIKRGSKIYLSASDGSSYIVFDHLDGMYSLCYTEKGSPCHLYRFTRLAPHQDGYCVSVDAEED